MNEKMSEELAGINFSGRKLPSALFGLVAQGFDERDGCFFIRALAGKQTNAALKDFPDRTGWECFVNSLHVDDYVATDYLANACLLVMAVFKEWRFREEDGIYQAIISNDEYGATVKFHLLRDGAFWLGSHLDGYEEAILLLDSCGGEEFIGYYVSGFEKGD